MRSATGGLAAMETRTPIAIKSRTDDSSARSMVNHQRASAPRSLREIRLMRGLPWSW